MTTPPNSRPAFFGHTVGLGFLLVLAAVVVLLLDVFGVRIGDLSDVQEAALGLACFCASFLV